MKKHHGSCPLRGQFKIVWNGVEGSKPHPSPPPLSSRAFCLSLTSITHFTHLSNSLLFNPISPRNITPFQIWSFSSSPKSSGMNYKSVESCPKLDSLSGFLRPRSQTTHPPPSTQPQIYHQLTWQIAHQAEILQLSAFTPLQWQLPLIEGELCLSKSANRGKCLFVKERIWSQERPLLGGRPPAPWRAAENVGWNVE